MVDTGTYDRSEGWRRFMGRHKGAFAIFVVAAILALAGTVLVFLWFVGHAQSTGMVPSSLNQWTMGYLITFLLNLIFWEIVLIGVLAAIGAVAGWLWWRRLPFEERREYHFFGPRSRTSNGGNAFSFLVFIAFCIKIYLDGNWNVAFFTWTFDYLVYSVVTALIWILIIFGIPMALGLIWWVSRGMKRWQ